MSSTHRVPASRPRRGRAQSSNASVNEPETQFRRSSRRGTIASTASSRGTRARRARGSQGSRSAPDLSEASRDETSSSAESGGVGGWLDDSVIEEADPSRSQPEPASLQNPTTNNQLVDLTCDQDDEILILDERRNDLPIVIGGSYVGPPHPRVPKRRRRPPTLDIHLDVDLPQTENRSTVNVTIDLDRSDYYVSPDTPPTPPGRGAARNEAEQRTSTEVTVECGICFDSLGQMKAANKRIMSTFCGHLFCFPCLSEAMKATMMCPQCRKKLTTAKIHQIFI